MMKVRNLGKKSFDEVKEKLQSLGFDLAQKRNKTAGSPLSGSFL